MPRKTAAVSAHVLCTSCKHAPCHVTSCKKLSHIRRMHACLVVNGHLHVWHNDQDEYFYVLLQKHEGETDTEVRVNTVSWPWRRKPPPLLPGLESAMFRSRVWRSNHLAIPARLKIWNSFNLGRTTSGSSHTFCSQITGSLITTLSVQVV